MKEVLTRKFWKDVKKTFEDAQKEPAPELQPGPPQSQAPIEESANKPIPSTTIPSTPEE